MNIESLKIGLDGLPGPRSLVPGEFLVCGPANPKPQPPQPLVWPRGFPATDWWGRFFTGIPPLGPSVSFFRSLEHMQSKRTVEVMQAWQDPRERGVALCFGECVKALGWKTPFFVPEDQALAVMGGPSFRAYGQQDRAYLLYDINRALGQTTKPEFLSTVINWDDPSVRFGDLVEKVTAELLSARGDAQGA